MIGSTKKLKQSVKEEEREEIFVAKKKRENKYHKGKQRG
jgi:hypothetical protein